LAVEKEFSFPILYPHHRSVPNTLGSARHGRQRSPKTTPYDEPNLLSSSGLSETYATLLKGVADQLLQNPESGIAAS